MADRKLFDLTIGVMVGVFVLTIIFFVVGDMDSATSNYDISNHIGDAYLNASSVDSSSRNTLDNDIFNGSNFNLNIGQQIDTRMQGQGVNYGSSSKGLVQNFMLSANLSNWDLHNGLITKFIISMFVLIVGILLARMMLGYTRV